jgi:hypothetical protein
MNVKEAARDMAYFVRSSDLPLEHPEYGKNHLMEMINKLTCGEIQGEKAHRWLGWIQGCVCVGGGANLETMKLINKST